MIVVKAIQDEDKKRPERQLTPKEWSTVTSILSNGEKYIYYQGDEHLHE